MFSKMILFLSCVLTFFFVACSSSKNLATQAKKNGSSNEEPISFAKKNFRSATGSSYSEAEWEALPGAEKAALIEEARENLEAIEVLQNLTAEDHKSKFNAIDASNPTVSDMQYLAAMMNISNTIAKDGGGFYEPNITATNKQKEVEGYDGKQSTGTTDGSREKNFYKVSGTGVVGSTGNHDYTFMQKVLGDKYSTYASNMDNVSTYVYEYTEYQVSANAPKIEGTLEVVKNSKDDSKEVVVAGELRVTLAEGNKTISIHFGTLSSGNTNGQYSDSVVLDENNLAKSGKVRIKSSAGSNGQKEYDLDPAQITQEDVTLFNHLGLFTVIKSAEAGSVEE